MFAAQLLIAESDFLDYAYTSAQIAAELNVHEELAIFKALILNRRGYKFKIPYHPSPTYLGKQWVK